MTILRPLLGRLTQGCLFSCARAESYEGCLVHGFVITARCDVEQRKFPVLNYVPVVRLDDWLQRDGLNILEDRLKAETEGSAKSLLKSCGISDTILYSKSWREVYNEFFVDKADARAKREEARYRMFVERLEFLQSASDHDTERGKTTFSLNEKMSTALIRELVQQRLSGFYFLPNVYDNGVSDGYVILLREVRHLKRKSAELVASGLEAPKDGSLLDLNLTFDGEQFAMPVGELSSPIVEHVLQTFSLMFGRIGLDDPPQAFVDEISRRRPAGAKQS